MGLHVLFWGDITFSAALRKIKADGGVEVQLHSFLTLAQDEG
jgi:hypothetical protein